MRRWWKTYVCGGSAGIQTKINSQHPNSKACDKGEHMVIVECCTYVHTLNQSKRGRGMKTDSEQCGCASGMHSIVDDGGDESGGFADIDNAS
jgi:hypothetical protein